MTISLQFGTTVVAIVALFPRTQLLHILMPAHGILHLYADVALWDEGVGVFQSVSVVLDRWIYDPAAFIGDEDRCPG